MAAIDASTTSTSSNEARLNALLAAIPDLVLVVDEDGVYVDVFSLDRREGLLYRQAEQLLGRSFHEVLPSNRADEFLDVVRRTLHTGQPQRHEYTLPVREGMHWFEGLTAPLHNPAHSKRCVVWAAREISTRKSAERARLEAQEAERRRLARELHDATAQSLTSVLAGLQVVAQQVHACCGGATPNAQAILEKVAAQQATIHAALDDLDRIVKGLRPEVLDDLGFVAAAKRYVEDYRRQHNLAVSLHLHDLGERVDNRDAPVWHVLFRVLQEALTNVARHAQATEVSVLAHRIDGSIQLIIEDNGRGFDQTGARGFGLTGIRERVQLVGGSASIESTPDHGTVVSVRLDEAP